MRDKPDRTNKLMIERTTLRTVIAALIGILSGIGLLYVSGLPNTWIGQEALQSVVRDLGALLVATVAIGVMWELWGKRALLDEVLAKTRLAEQIRAAGIISVSRSSYEGGWDWGDLLNTTNRLDVFFAYGRTWRRICHNHLVKLAAKEHCRIRVVLPDPDDDISMSSMADRFETTPSELTRRILEAKEFFQNLPPENAIPIDNVKIWFRRGTTQFSFYILDNVAILVLYSHTSTISGRTISSEPAFVVQRRSWMYNWLQGEFSRMIEGLDGRTKKIS